MQVAQLKTHSLKKHNEIRKRNAKFTKKTLKKEETLETFAPTEFTDNYRVSKVKLDETEWLFQRENMKKIYIKMVFLLLQGHVVPQKFRKKKITQGTQNLCLGHRL